jgi:FkbM family methyltransferase
MPFIKNKFPQTELHIYCWKNRLSKFAIEQIVKNSNYIKCFDRVNQKLLANAYLEADIWLYPTELPETYCITALEAQASKCLCVCSKLAGLIDTVSDRGILIDKLPETLHKLFEILDNVKLKNKLLENGHMWASRQTFRNLTQEWLQIFEAKDKYKYSLRALAECDLPNDHLNYLKSLKKNGFEPKVIYDIGSCVLNWTKYAKQLWPDAKFYLFDGFDKVEFLYNEYDYEYHIGVLSDKDGKLVNFYQNDALPYGNSYYKEIGHPLSSELFNETHLQNKISYTLDTVANLNKFPSPDLVKINVQGSELDIIMGAQLTFAKTSYLIAKLQKNNYNDGAPLVENSLPIIEKMGWKCVAPLFCDNGVDGDYSFLNINI